MKSFLRTILPNDPAPQQHVELPFDFKTLLNFNRTLSVRNGETHTQPEGERAIGRSLYIESVEFNVGGEHVQLRTEGSPYFRFMLPVTGESKTVVIQTPECVRMLIGPENAHPVRFTVSGAYDETSGHLNVVGTLLPHNNPVPILINRFHLVYSEV